jgi:hypothetical protein
MTSRIFDLRKIKLVYFRGNSDLTASWTIGGEIPTRARAPPLLRNVQLGSGAHPVSYFFSGGKVGHEFYHSRPSSTEIKNECI